MITLKRCYDCHAMLPISDYGKSRSTEDQLNRSCKACIRELGRVKYTLKYGHLESDRVHIANNRIIKYHNRNLIQHCLDNPSTIIYGFVPHTELTFRVSIGPSSSLSKHNCLRLTLLNYDSPDQEYIYDPALNPNVVPTLLYILKSMSIRLEKTETDMLDSKQSIYYIGLL